MNQTPRANRLHIALFGRRNTGKSSLINALTNQETALVSAIAGTTTDPVFKAMEMLPLGPVVIIDTAGLDDTGDLGVLRIQRSLEVFNKADMVLLVLDSLTGITGFEQDIVERCRQKKLPLVAVINKTDIQPATTAFLRECQEKLGIMPLAVSALTSQGISEVKTALVNSAPPAWDEQGILGDLLSPGDLAVLVAPIDRAAPKGRLILPQVQVLRDVLDHDALAYVVKEEQLEECLGSLKKKPRIVITDSQVFSRVDAITPPDIHLTSFSILFARYKGDLATLTAGARALETLKPGDKVLIAEACSHHRMEDDIGTVKLPRWLNHSAGGKLEFHWLSGPVLSADLARYKLVIHCGACMINRREMLARLEAAQTAEVPIVNYGICIAYLKGILPRALSPFPDYNLFEQKNNLNRRLS
jgi:[FeFe] hydrogenase H-cluster maturation GTPase HydF